MKSNSQSMAGLVSSKVNPVSPTDLKSSQVPLNFKVPEEFRQQLKIAAAKEKKTMAQIIIEAFRLWEEKNTLNQ